MGVKQGAIRAGDPSTPTSRLLGILLICALGAACGLSPRPRTSEWKELWEAERRLLPDAARLGGPDARAVCTELLEVIHGARRELLPTPDEVLDRTVESWIRRAGSLAYECPGADGDLERVSSAMQKLAELEAEIDAALRLRAGAVAS